MKKFVKRAVVALSLGVVGTWFAAGHAVAQQGALAKQIVGTWTLVSAENTHTDGKKSYPFGQNPKGVSVFDAGGNFVVVNTTPGIAKFASNSRATGTPEENKAAVSSSIGLFGTYTVNEADKTMVWRVEGSTYPNWVGEEQKRPVASVTANELVYINPAASVGGATTRLVWKRLK